MPPSQRPAFMLHRLMLGFLIAWSTAACGDTAESERPASLAEETAVPESVASLATAPDSSLASSDTLLDRWRGMLPESALTRRGACPFECCVYREWTAESRIPLVPEPGTAGEPTVAHLEPGTSFQADSGHVRIEQLALIAVTEPVIPMPERRLEPGDTLVLLDYVGEGFHNVWWNGEFLEVADFWSSATDRPRGEVIGEHRSSWWVHATAADGATGWFRADAPGVEIAGADACGATI